MRYLGYSLGPRLTKRQDCLGITFWYRSWMCNSEPNCETQKAGLKTEPTKPAHTQIIAHIGGGGVHLPLAALPPGAALGH